MACSSVPVVGKQHKRMHNRDKTKCNNAYGSVAGIKIGVSQLTEPFAGFADGLDVGDDVKVLVVHDGGLGEKHKIVTWMKIKNSFP